MERLWGDGDSSVFQMFSLTHFAAIGFLCIMGGLLLIFSGSMKINKSGKTVERLFAFTLIITESLYYVWISSIGSFDLSDSLPLELCSVSLILSVVLLLTGNRRVYDFVFFAGIAGSLQAVFTPVLFIDFPHFRYFHFFYTHIGIILTALYFTWVKGYRPTIKGLAWTMVFLNLLLPVIFMINKFVGGNYMFLRRKPSSGSLLDLLGPYPWYIVSLEAVAVVLFLFLWLLFRERRVDRISVEQEK
ncbi:TIGR02206 family membrane protein [Bacillus sp. M6-12]|uniref:YwaF family protein n=1 Tax=Bacillus sp. M6-12 TaxID=2054166 RepID=UPI000C78F70F|nr:TIGR02206 family membrane protein [Bacillus sp. M6-12]PLS18433.1 TIGR02206 family membrane protein [Bacillus sp. M6-12]